MHSLNDNDISAMIYKSSGEMAEWSIAAVLKTVEVRASGGSNPSLSAENESSNKKVLDYQLVEDFFFYST